MKTFSAILTSLKTSPLWDWHRDGSLAIFHDDFKADRRHVYRVRIPREKNRTPRIALTVLRGFDPVKNVWGETVHSECREGDIESRRGEKALREYIKEIAVILKGYPNPEFLSYTEFSDGPKLREHREREEYFRKMEAARNA